MIMLITSDPNGVGLVDNPMPANPNFKKSTLIVCPMSVIENWIGQIKTHVAADRLSVYMYYGRLSQSYYPFSVYLNRAEN